MPDVNVLVYAIREDAPRHDACRQWLEAAASSEQPFAISELVLSGFVRIVTNRKVFREPVPLPWALRFCRELLARDSCVVLRPGPRHFGLFMRLCEQGDVTGGAVSDAYHAAIAMEHGCSWVTCDRDFRRYDGLALHEL